MHDDMRQLVSQRETHPVRRHPAVQDDDGWETRKPQGQPVDIDVLFEVDLKDENARSLHILGQVCDRPGRHPPGASDKACDFAAIIAVLTRFDLRKRQLRFELDRGKQSTQVQTAHVRVRQNTIRLALRNGLPLPPHGMIADRQADWLKRETEQQPWYVQLLSQSIYDGIAWNDRTIFSARDDS